MASTGDASVGDQPDAQSARAGVRDHIYSSGQQFRWGVPDGPAVSLDERGDVLIARLRRHGLVEPRDNMARALLRSDVTAVLLERGEHRD